MADLAYMRQVLAEKVKARELAEKATAPPPKPPSKKEYSAMGSLGRGALQGVTLGFGDELAALPYLWPGGKTYTESRDESRTMNEAAQRDNPLAYLGGEVGSGLAAGLVTAPFTGGGSLAGAGARTAATLGRAMKSGAKIGAATGGLAGAGHAEELADVPRETAKGAGMGLAAGAVLPAIPAATRGINPLSARNRALSHVKKELNTMDPEMNIRPGQGVAETLADNPNLVAADVNKQLGQRLGQAAQDSPDAARASAKLLDVRHKAQADRLSEALPEPAELANIKDAASSLYDEAYTTAIKPNASMRKVLRMPEGKRALAEAQRRMGNKLEGVGDTIAGPNRPNLTSPQLWDEMQRVMGDKVQTLKLTQPAKSRDVKKLQKAITDGMESQSPAFKEARQLWRGQKAGEDAFEFGTKAITGKESNVVQTVSDMGLGERIQFREGVFRQIRDRMASRPEGAKLSTMFADKETKTAVRLAFSDESLYKRFMRNLDDEEAMEDTFRLAGNKTMTARSKSVGAPHGIGDIPVKALIKAGQWTGGWTRPRESMVGKALLSQGDPLASIRSQAASPFSPRTTAGMVTGLAAPGPQQYEGLLPSVRPPLPQ